jgi:tetratricopeptide (TPR) repeat protein
MQWHFLSYSSVDGQDFALRLGNALQAGPPEIPVWFDRRKLQAGLDWDEQLVEAIRACETFLFVMTRDSVKPTSVCKQEWTRALKYKKPIIPLRLHADAEMPFRLEPLQFVDFSGSFDAGLARLVNRLEWQRSPEGQLAALKYRLADAERDLERTADTAQRVRIEDDIRELQKDIEKQEEVVRDPEAAARRVAESIERGLERERKPERPVGGEQRSKFINPPPGVAPGYFQNRHVETKLIGDFLEDEAQRLVTVVGRGGTGKTAMVCRLLKSLEGGRLPDDGGPLEVEGIVYLSANGTRRVTTPNLYADLSKLLLEETAARLDELYKNPHVSTAAKMNSLLSNFQQGRTVLLLDNFEDLIDPESFNVRDTELDEALRALLEAAQHTVKVILTTRVAPRDLMLLQPGRQARIDLDDGLASPYAENILREMDADGKVGLRDAPAALLYEARQRTRGYPRALEALFAILSVDRDTTLRDILDDTTNILPENVVKGLVGEAFNRLDPTAQQVMQALAVYRHPVTPAAVDYLLQPYLPGVNSAPVLKRLVNMQFARGESRRYFLHPVDLTYALSRITKGEPTDRSKETPPYTQFALLHRAAEYFKQARLPRENWKTIMDLAPQLAEFDLRCEGGDYDTAAWVLHEIDFDYLLLWGYYRQTMEMHERLQGRLTYPSLKVWSACNLGTAYMNIGQLKKAITYSEQALKWAREAGDRQGEGVTVGNLGNCYYSLGQIARAIECYEQALAIDHEIGDRAGVGVDMGNLGNCYSDLGQTTRAIECYEEALAIALEVNSPQNEGNQLANLGNRYSDLGQTARSIEYHERSLAISREVGNRQLECIELGNLAGELINEGRRAEAIEKAVESVRIADEIGSPRHCSYNNSYLALVRFVAGDLPGARAAAEIAREYDEATNKHYVLALLGLIALRQGDVPGAQQAFAASVPQARELLTHNAQGYNALDSKGLALCGLAVCGDAGRVTEAIETYRAARAINKDVGVVRRGLRLFDALAEADTAGVLAGVRAAAAGEG